MWPAAPVVRVAVADRLSMDAGIGTWVIGDRSWERLSSAENEVQLWLMMTTAEMGMHQLWLKALLAGVQYQQASASAVLSRLIDCGS